jgi:hypothetical protein
MNERIKELAGQAKFMAEEDINRQISYNLELKAFAEKFAELIVQDYAKKTIQGLMSDPAFVQHMDEYYEQKWAHRFD